MEMTASYGQEQAKYRSQYVHLLYMPHILGRYVSILKCESH